MAKPPEDVPASVLFQKLLQRQQPSEVVDFPCAGFGKVRVFVQNDAARSMATRAAEDWYADFASKAKKATALVSQEALIGDATARELIARSVHDVEPFAGEGADARYRRVFPDGDAVAQVLSPHEVSTLFGYYLLVQQKYGPGDRDMADPGEINAWIETLADGAAKHSFLALDLYQQVALCTKLAERARALKQTLSLTGEELESFLESLPESWSSDTSSPGKEPSDSSAELSEPELITPEAAMRLARRMSGD